MSMPWLQRDVPVLALRDLFALRLEESHAGNQLASVCEGSMTSSTYPAQLQVRVGETLGVVLDELGPTGLGSAASASSRR